MSFLGVDNSMTAVKLCWSNRRTHDEPQIKTRVTEFSEQAQPDWHPHFHAARAGDIAQIDNIAAFPAEPFAEPTCDFALRGFAIAADS